MIDENYGVAVQFDEDEEEVSKNFHLFKNYCTSFNNDLYALALKGNFLYWSWKRQTVRNSFTKL